MLARLIKARQAAELMQEELADRLGKVQSHISLIEQREREISFVEVFRWCEATNVRFSDFAQEFEKDIYKMRVQAEKRHDKENPG